MIHKLGAGELHVTTVKHETKWTFIIIGIFLIWGSFYPVSKYIVTDIDPPLAAFLRYFFALVTLTPFFVYKSLHGFFPQPRDILMLSLVGLLGITLFALLLFYGIKLSTSSVSSILGNTQPVFGPVLALFILHETFTLRELAGVFIGTVGMAVVVMESGDAHGGYEIATLSSALVGNISCILASIVISLYYILLKKYIQRYGSIIATTVSFFSGGAALLAAVFILDSDVSVLYDITLFEWTLVFYNGAIATAFVYIIHNISLREIGVVRTLRLKFLIPVFGVILSVALLQEKVNLNVLIGMSVVVSAIFVLQWPDKRIKKQKKIDN